MNPLSFIKPAIYLAMILSIGTGGYYLMNMKAALEIEKQNVKTLETAIKQQQEVILVAQKEIQEISEANRRVVELVEESNDRIRTLDDKLEADRLSRLSKAKPKVLEKLITRGSKNAVRCMEIVSGSPLTEEEISATKLSQANRECVWIHPNLER